MSNWAVEKGTHLAPKTGPVPDSCCDSLISGTNLLSCTVETGGVQELVSYTITQLGEKGNSVIGCNHFVVPEVILVVTLFLKQKVRHLRGWLYRLEHVLISV